MNGCQIVLPSLNLEENSEIWSCCNATMRGKPNKESCDHYVRASIHWPMCAYANFPECNCIEAIEEACFSQGVDVDVILDAKSLDRLEDI